MTKDSICKDCVWRKRVVYEYKAHRDELRSCNKMVDGDLSHDVKVVKCSEFERVQKGGKIPHPKPERFQHIPIR